MSDTLLLIFLLSISLFAVWIALVERRYIRRTTEERNAMLGIFSHQIRTPLSSVNWYTELALNEAEEESIALIEYVSYIRTGITQSIKRLDQFLKVFRTEACVSFVEPKKIEVSEVIEKTISAYQKRAEDKNIAVNFKRVDHFLFTIFDPLLLHSIVDVILSNAIWYSREGGSIEIYTKSSGKMINIYFKDNGVGIPRNERFFLFTKFFRGEKAKIMNPDGNGLSLYFTKVLLQRNHGTINCKSEHNKGTLIWIGLPKATHSYPKQLVSKIAKKKRE